MREKSGRSRQVIGKKNTVGPSRRVILGRDK